MSRYRKFLQLFSTYILGDILTKGGAFFLLPVYTRFLTPPDYGVISVITMVTMLLSMTLSLGSTGALLRFIPQMNTDQARYEFTTSLWMLMLTSVGTAILLILPTGRLIFETVFSQVPYVPYVPLALIVVFFQTTCINLIQTFQRAQEHANAYVRFSVTLFVVNATLTLSFIVGLRLGVLGWFLGQATSTLVMGLVAGYGLARLGYPRFRREPIRLALTYGLPLVPHLMSQWIIDASDRIILERHVSLNDLGIYSLAYQFSAVLVMLIMAVGNAITPTFSRASVDEHSRQLVQYVATYALCIIALVALAIALLADPVIRLLLPVTYHAAGLFVPWIILGYLIFGIYLIMLSVLTFTVGKSNIVPLITMSGASVNIGLNLWLIPLYGSLAAAINTVIGFAIMAMITFLFVRRVTIVRLQFLRIAMILLSTILVFGIGSAAQRFTPSVNLLIGILSIAVLPIMWVTTGFFYAHERAAIQNIPGQFLTLLNRSN